MPNVPNSYIDWQPIETAPKDGSAVLVWPPTWRGVLSAARWDSDYGKKPNPYWRRIDAHAVMDSRNNPPTHWAPPPEGPKNPAPPGLAEVQAKLAQAQADACPAAEMPSAPSAEGEK